jgi:hypothetical protein
MVELRFRKWSAALLDRWIVGKVDGRERGGIAACPSLA